MRIRPVVLILVAFFILSLSGSPILAQAPTAASIQGSGADAARVGAFMKTLSDAISVDNHLKVASLVKYPLEAWADGQVITVRNDSELLARYRQIFDKSLRESIAMARTEAPGTHAEGVTACGGRLVLRQASDKNASLRIVKIGEPGGVR